MYSELPDGEFPDQEPIKRANSCAREHGTQTLMARASLRVRGVGSSEG